MEKLIEDFLKHNNFAVCGSFRNEQKYAYRIFRQLTERGHKVFPVNPRLTELEGVKCYQSVKDIREPVDVVNIVTPPKATLRIVNECFQLGISRVWIQPGAENAEVIEFCKENDIKAVYGLCVMLEAARHESS